MYLRISKIVENPKIDEYNLEIEPIFLSEPEQVKVLGEELIKRVSL